MEAQVEEGADDVHLDLANVCIVEDEASGLKEDEDRINTRVPIDG